MRLLRVLFENAQAVAVVEVQPPEVGLLFLGEAALHSVVPVSGSGLGSHRDLILRTIPEHPAADSLYGVILPQIPGQAEKPLLARRPDGDVFAEFVFVAHLPKVVEELPVRHGVGDHLVYICLDHGPPGGLPFLLRLVFRIVLGPTLTGFQDHGEPVFQTDPVGHLPHPVEECGVGMEPLSIHEGHGVYHKMVVYMRFLVQMGGHQHLEAVAPEFIGKLHTDLMGLLRRDLSGGEGLIAVEGHCAAGFSELLLRGGHDLLGGVRGAVDAGDQTAKVGLSVLGHILEGRAQQIGMSAELCLFFIGSVAEDVAKLPLHRPDLSGRHGGSSPAGYCPGSSAVLFPGTAPPPRRISGRPPRSKHVLFWQSDSGCCRSGRAAAS